MTRRVKYISLIIIALTGFFMGERIYEDHQIASNKPTIFILAEESENKGTPLNTPKEITINILEDTKEAIRDILSGSKKISSEMEESLELETKTSLN